MKRRITFLTSAAVALAILGTSPALAASTDATQLRLDASGSV